MDREQLTALRDAIDTVLTWPDRVREQIARWLAPEGAKPNGLDPHPPPAAASDQAPVSDSKASPPPLSPVEARCGAPQASRPGLPDRLLEAMRKHPGASVAILARAVGPTRSTTGERLRSLEKRGAVEKDDAGRWRIAAAKASPAPSQLEASPRPIQPSPAAS